MLFHELKQSIFLALFLFIVLAFIVVIMTSPAGNNGVLATVSTEGRDVFSSVTTSSHPEESEVFATNECERELYRGTKNRTVTYVTVTENGGCGALQSAKEEPPTANEVPSEVRVTDAMLQRMLREIDQELNRRCGGPKHLKYIDGGNFTEQLLTKKLSEWKDVIGKNCARKEEQLVQLKKGLKGDPWNISANRPESHPPTKTARMASNSNGMQLAHPNSNT